MQTLVEDVREHVEEEEQLLPKLRDALSEERLRRAGDKLQAAKSRAPTSPSSVDPDSATRQELYERAQDLDVEGRSKMDKQDLAREVSKRE